jgi:hypothetical protein
VPRGRPGRARAENARPSAPTLWRRARTDGSDASANDPRVLVGLGRSAEAPVIRVTWPGGATETWSGLPVDRYSTLGEWSGR